MLTTPKMSENGTKATCTSHHTSSLLEIQLAEIQIRQVLKLAKKKQALLSSFALNYVLDKT